MQSVRGDGHPGILVASSMHICVLSLESKPGTIQGMLERTKINF